MSPVGIEAVAAASAFGTQWRGLSGARGLLRPTTLLADVAPGLLTAEVAALPALRVEPRQLRLMSRAARLAVFAASQAVLEAGWTTTDGAGFFLGVGASGGDLQELSAMLAVSLEDGRVSPDRLGRAGLLASSPLSIFQVMSHYTLCHPAIALGTDGPNGAFFSRGGGTVVALIEAVYALQEGDCERALVGGADSALHPVAYAEFVRDGALSDGLVLAEGAALLALCRNPARPLALVEQVTLGSEPGPVEGPLDVIVTSAWGRAPVERLRAWAAREHPGVQHLELGPVLGDALAAAPALAWAAALDALLAGGGRRALVVTAGLDGAVGQVVLVR